MSSAEPSALPAGGDGFTMEVAGGGVEMATTVAWAQVEDVHLALIGITMGGGADVDPHETARECDLGDRDCRDRLTQRAESDAQEEIDAEFDEVLEAGVDALESGL